MPRPPLSIEQILSWADAHLARTGKFPNSLSGPVHEAPQESWANISGSLFTGTRGLVCRKMTLAKLLQEHRGKRNKGRLPNLTVSQILAWADGAWPDRKSGEIEGVLGENWLSVWIAIYSGSRGLKQHRSRNVAELLRNIR